MNPRRIALVVGLVLAGFGATQKTAWRPVSAFRRPSRLPQEQRSTNPQDFPFLIIPSDFSYVVREGDRFLVDFLAGCPQNVDDTAKFELMPPTPPFVFISPACRCEGSAWAIGQLTVAPGIGDAGTYSVIVLATTCSGFSNPFALSVKVKRASQSPASAFNQTDRPPQAQRCINPQDCPVFINPSTSRYVVHEGDQFLVDVLAECPQNVDDTVKFELMPPTPAFVNIVFPDPLISSGTQSACRCEGSPWAMAQLVVAPGTGNAGKYNVQVRATSCSGLEQILGFQVRVKPASQ